ncbi:MAG: 3'-5' exonuclease [Bryobacteraceae bacterium]|nr:3'-5' exonuclease [Bryobacteraceae bacterium]
MTDRDELERALDYPWEKWAIFLHPAQRRIVERDFAGPARVAGSAGTGKTIVALHRAVHVARANPHARVLLTTFSKPLANALLAKLRILIHHEPRLGERIEVAPLDEVGRRLYERSIGPAHFAPARVEFPPVDGFTPAFLQSEWDQVVDAWQVDSWQSYRDVPRLGRRTRLSENQRRKLWTIFEKVRADFAERGLVTRAGVFSRLQAVPYDFVVVDEAQDIGVAQLRFLAASGAKLFFAGDLGQRIFQRPFSWKALGVDVRGRSSTLKVNYRTSHQIRSRADRLLGEESVDVDGNVEERKGTVSVFNGPTPEIRVLPSSDAERDAVADWLKGDPTDAAVFVRSDVEIPRARAAVERAGLPFQVLDERVDTVPGKVAIATMHLAKGLEFRSVAVMACDEEILPSQARIETTVDDGDLEEVYSTERYLLYVACTRARDRLLVTGASPASEFLDDLLVARSSA